MGKLEIAPHYCQYIDLNGNENLANEDYRKSIELFKERNRNKEVNPQVNDTNMYLSLLLLGDLNSQMEMKKLESKWENNKSAFEIMISVKKMGKKELISQIFIE